MQVSLFHFKLKVVHHKRELSDLKSREKQIRLQKAKIEELEKFKLEIKPEDLFDFKESVPPAIK